METKLKNVIEKCIKNGAPYNSCGGCRCSEKECLINLLEEYNNSCEENGQIDYPELD